MRTAHKVWAGIAALTFTVVAMGGHEPEAEPARAAAPAAAPSFRDATGYRGPTPSGADWNGTDYSGHAGYGQTAAAPAPPPGEQVTVTRVIDGDTFEVAGGRKVRVLGLDSCEMSTPGGPDAKQVAERDLALGQVTLRRQPGVDTDRYGRELRYVSVGSTGSDLAESMVIGLHSGVYGGRNDADPAYLDGLRENDSDGRDCQFTYQGGTSTESDQVYVDSGDDDGGRCDRKWYC